MFVPSENLWLVNKLKDIPVDCYERLAVPVTVAGEWPIAGFDMIGVAPELIINGKKQFRRILIQKKRADRAVTILSDFL